MEYYNKIDQAYLTALKSPIIHPQIKIELMDFAENVIGELTQDISYEDSGNISVTYQQGLRRSCSITLINLSENLETKKGKFIPEENGIWLTTKFKIYTGIKIKKNSTQIIEQNLKYAEASKSQVGNLLYDKELEDTLLYNRHKEVVEDDYYWFSQGVYILTNPSCLRDLSKGTTTLEGVDKFGIFGSETNYNQTDATYVIPAVTVDEQGNEIKTTVGNVIKTILDFDKGNQMPLDNVAPYIDANIANQELPFDINKSPETYFSDILIELANVFACDIFYDTEGRLNFVKGNEQRDMESYSSLWDYTDESPEYFSPTLNYEFTNVYNCIKVIGNNPACDLYQYIAKNTDPTSPTRISLIGEKIKYIESTFCYNEDRTKDFAIYMLKKLAKVPLSLNFQSSFIPHLEVNNVITITDKFFGYVEQRFIIQTLDFPLNAKSLIDVECTNTANIPYFEY